MAHETLIAQFSSTAEMPGTPVRTATRNDIGRKMANIILTSKMMFDIQKYTSFDDIGCHMFAMVLIDQKLQNHKNAYYGPCISLETLKFLLDSLRHKSLYIQDISRNLVKIAVTKDKLDSSQLQTVIDHVTNLSDISDADTAKRSAWVVEMLLVLSRPDQDSLLGCMVGKCVGDALGFIVEGHGPDVCGKFTDEFVQTRTIPTWIRIQNLSFGQYSDDSQLARELLNCFVKDNGALTASRYGEHIASLFIPGNYRIVGYGKTCAQSGEALWKGSSYKETGCTTGHGNGSAMRSAPIGLLFASHSTSEIVDIAKKLSSITHARPRCMAGAAAIALATKYAMATKKIKFNVNTFSAFVAQTGDEQLDTLIKMMPSMMSWEMNEVCDYFVRVGLTDGESKWDGISAGVTQTVLWSLYSFCMNPDSYVDSVAMAIKIGGDVDTTGAIVGALSGCRLGLGAIPEIWRHTIHDIDVWDYNDICELVSQAITILRTNQTSLVF
jgi:ADP-ribosylglycohydrolase